MWRIGLIPSRNVGGGQTSVAGLGPVIGSPVRSQLRSERKSGAQKRTDFLHHLDTDLSSFFAAPMKRCVPPLCASWKGWMGGF